MILAAVSIATLTGKDGILGKATKAVEEYDEATMKEEASLLISEWLSDYYTDGTEIEGRSKTTASGAYIKYENGYVIYEKDGKTYEMEVNENGNIGDIMDVPEDKSSQEYQARHPENHIPVGFHHTIGSVSEGYVIADDEKNEFVWIPVDGTKIKYEKRLGKVNFSLKDFDGFKELSSIEEGIMGDMLGSFENKEEELASKLESEEITSDLKEKEIINNAGGFWVGRYEAGINTTQSREKSVIETTDEMGDNEEKLTSFNEYWKQHKKDVVVRLGMEPVRMISPSTALEVANSWKSSEDEDEKHVAFQSGLITGAQWDVMCEFVDWDLCNAVNSTWGNSWNILGQDGYTGFHSGQPGSNWITTPDVLQKPANEGSSGTNDTKRCTYWVFPTGKFVNSNGEGTEKKHIFDITGNVSEITTEVPKNGENYKMRRGSCAMDSSSGFSANARLGNQSVNAFAATLGFRIVLYVK